MSDIKSPALLWIKAAMFIVLGVIAGGVVLLESPTLRNAALLALCVWAFCRAYYFVFYVIEHYIDGQYRYAGLWSALQHLMRGRRPAD